MTLGKKMLYRIAILFLSFWILFPLCRFVFSIEFAKSSFKFAYTEFLFFAIPIATLLTLLGTLKSNDNNFKAFTKIMSTILLSMCFLFFMYISVFLDMCAWSSKTIYTHKFKAEDTIAIRSFECGAYDSDLPSFEVFKIKPFTKFFIRATKIDTTKIDMNDWLKVK